MPQNITLYKVFVASPSDVSTEREIVKKAIDNFNAIFSPELNARLELIRWETHTYPSVGKYPQDAINTQINNDYDIFIGILWNKFGTPTPIYDSGTEEEFYNALNIHHKNPNGVKIMMYFNNEGLPLNSIDIEQLSKIRTFKKNISDKGCLYRDYIGTNQFEGLMKDHLVLLIRDWKNSENNHNLPVLSTSIDENDLEEDLGLFELQDIIESKFREAVNFIEDFAVHTSWIGEETRDRTAELNTINSSNLPSLNNNSRVVLLKMAKGLTQYSNKIDHLVVNWFTSYKDAMKATEQLLNISNDFVNSENVEDLSSAKITIISMYNGINDCGEQIEAFMNALKNMPRMSQPLIIAQKNTSNKLKFFLRDMEQSKVIALNLIKLINAKIDEITFSILNPNT